MHKDVMDLLYKLAVCHDDSIQIQFKLNIDKAGDDPGVLYSAVRSVGDQEYFIEHAITSKMNSVRLREIIGETYQELMR